METQTKLSKSATQALGSQNAEAIYSELKEEGYSLLITKNNIQKLLAVLFQV